MHASPQIETLRFIPRERSPFFTTVRSRVEAYFQEKKIAKTANTEMVVKTIVLLGTYLITYGVLVSGAFPVWVLWVNAAIMGASVAGIGMSIMHDANHGAYSRSAKVNEWVGYSLNLAGGAVFNWKLQHNILHHTYTNISTHDEDVKNRAVLRFSPNGLVKPFHRFQFVYAFLFYGLITLYWVLAKDLVQLQLFKRIGVNRNSPRENTILFWKITFIKIAYLTAFMVGPVYFGGLSIGLTIGLFVFMHFVAGIILTLVFQLAHTVEGTDHPLPNEDNVIAEDWAIHQLKTTKNFSRNNRLLSWYLGGLNYQVEHHLFPKICHVHYPAISHIVKATAEEFGIPYQENPDFLTALKSHVRYLKELGELPSWNDAIAG